MKQMPLQPDPETERTLATLDQPETIKADPWFHSRLMRRIESLETGPQSRSIRGWFGLCLRPSLVVAVVALNVAITVQVWRTVAHDSGPIDATSNPAAQLAQEYGYQSQGVLWTWSGE